jgi:hypothetical protein
LIAWLAALFEEPPASKERPLQISRFGIGFCPGCKRLRSVTSLRCADCNSPAPVTEDH